MPGPTRWRGQALPHAVTSNKIREYVLDERVRAVLKTVKLAAKSKIPEQAPEKELDEPEDRALSRRVAAESIVLLKNESKVLPFDNKKPIAVIGPNAKSAAYCGGGSASLAPYYAITPFQGLASQCQSTIRFQQGTYGHKELPLLGTLLQHPNGKQGFRFRVYDKPSTATDRKLLDELHLIHSYMLLMDYKVPNLEGCLYYIDVDATFTPAEDGIYDLGLTVEGTARLLLDGKLLVDNATKQRPGSSFFGAGTMEETAPITLEAGRSYSVKVEFGSAATSTLERPGIVSFGPGGLRIGGCKRLDPELEIVKAVQLASECEQAVIFAGLNGDWESEGYDRLDMESPLYVDDLITRVLAANPRTVVVLQSGTPVAMPWADSTSTILQAWYGGNETGNAIADVLYGQVNPSGKLPMTFPRHLAQNPAFLSFRSERGRVLYGEDVYVGYRYYDKLSISPLFPFGHGLSYTTFRFSDLEVTQSQSEVPVSSPEASIIVHCCVVNTGTREGAEVVQVYVQQLKPSISRPPKELKGFKKVFLQPGEKKTVRVNMERRYACSFWDEGRDQWIVEQGKYKIMIGRSSRAGFLEQHFEVQKTGWWHGI